MDIGDLSDVRQLSMAVGIWAERRATEIELAIALLRMPLELMIDWLACFSTGACSRSQRVRSRGVKMARPQFAATPSGRRYSDRTLEFPTEMIDVAKSARFGDLGKRRIVPDDEGLRIYETFPLQPSARARAQMPAKQPPDLRVAEARRCA